MPVFDPIPLSALQHYAFCPRQCALIHVERLWEENRLTAEGRVFHENAHDGPAETRGGVRTVRGLPVSSHTYGIGGVCDVVEFHANGRVIPVEYKRGKPKRDASDAVQLCAQALCLEDMLKVAIPVGLLYYGQTRRRVEIPLDEALRRQTLALVREVRTLLDTRTTPPAVRAPRCDNCSLLDQCLPDAGQWRRGAQAWFRRRLQADLESEPDRERDAKEAEPERHQVPWAESLE
ncbi:CRISPR-associated protein Cas4 [Opitutaceae bacterium TAV1]|nr:CRISPR-associated protein Cas4 [Opitutaceae bacterium TAV1]